MDGRQAIYILFMHMGQEQLMDQVCTYWSWKMHGNESRPLAEGLESVREAVCLLIVHSEWRFSLVYF